MAEQIHFFQQSTFHCNSLEHNPAPKRHVNVMTYDLASAAVTDNSECVLILSTLLREEDEKTKVF